MGQGWRIPTFVGLVGIVGIANAAAQVLAGAATARGRGKLEGGRSLWGRGAAAARGGWGCSGRRQVAAQTALPGQQLQPIARA